MKMQEFSYLRLDHVHLLGSTPRRVPGIGIVFMNSNGVMMYRSYDESELSKSRDMKVIEISPSVMINCFNNRLIYYPSGAKIGLCLIESILNECSPHVYISPDMNNRIAIRNETDAFLKQMIGVIKFYGKNLFHLLKDFLSKAEDTYDFSIADDLWNDIDPWDDGTAFLLAYVDFWYGEAKTHALIEGYRSVCGCMECLPRLVDEKCISSDKNRIDENNNNAHIQVSELLDVIEALSLNLQINDNPNIDDNRDEANRVRETSVTESVNNDISDANKLISNTIRAKIVIESRKTSYQKGINEVIDFINEMCIDSCGSKSIITTLFSQFKDYPKYVNMSNTTFWSHMKLINRITGKTYVYRCNN